MSLWDEPLQFAQEPEFDLGTQEAVTPWKILIVDDEEEVHQITRLTLRHAKVEGRPLTCLSAFDGAEAIALLRACHTDIAIVLLDVVMEQDHAGFEVVKVIREELQNRALRVLLRTGQPGIAPERKTIEAYDIDDYLPKAQLSSERLFTAVRTGLRAYMQILRLHRQRELLSMMHQLTSAFYALGSLDASLERILQIAHEILPTPLALLEVTSSLGEKPVRYFFYLSDDTGPNAKMQALTLAERIAYWRLFEASASAESFDPFRQGEACFLRFETELGLLVPIPLHPRLGVGWMFLQSADIEPFAQQMLLLLAAHASNAFCATIGQAFLTAQEQPASQAIII